MESSLFLLGGNDLEMEEIKKILSCHKCNFIDSDLTWEAQLSQYQDYLQFDGTIYGIELEEDLRPPLNYVPIDHHGKYDNNPSSLEQIANLLHVTLTREQQIIAANDSRYISGMKTLCASQKEIDQIRKKDRVAQGITQKDEELAKGSLQEAKDNFLFCKTSKFAALSDLAYYKFDKYIIYNENKIVFYGYKKEKVLTFLISQNLKESDYYYGGGEFGFVGIKDTKKVNEILKEFRKVGKKEELYSYHIFMLPFIFEGDFKKNENWNNELFDIKNQRDYNEFVYFYKHVQDAIYNNETDILKNYVYAIQDGTYTINCNKGEFELELDGISLRIFNTNIAILAFNLKNTKYSKLEDILAINDFGRRIYPHFLGEKFTVDTKESILANCITLNFKNEEPIIENFSGFDTLEGIKEPNLLPRFITKLIEDNFKKTEDKTTIRPIIDDRMFVLSWYGNNVFSENLKCEEYIQDTKWYEYVFVDGNGMTVNSEKMRTDLITNATYDRWMDNPYGCTLYGISRYSFVAVTNESDFAKNVILQHMKTVYFQIFTLLLAYRSTIIKFADEIQDATSSDTSITDKSKKIYKRYLKFLNKLYFKEITAQEQGIEIYNKAMKIMDIEKYMNDLDHEINELHNYVSLLEEEKRNTKLDKISLLGAILLPPTFVTGFLGMNIINFEKYTNNLITLGDGSKLVATIVFSAILSGLAYYFVKKGQK